MYLSGIARVECTVNKNIQVRVSHPPLETSTTDSIAGTKVLLKRDSQYIATDSVLLVLSPLREGHSTESRGGTSDDSGGRMLHKILVALSAWFVFSMMVGLLVGRAISTLQRAYTLGFAPALETDWETTSPNQLESEDMLVLSHRQLQQVS